MKKIMKNKYGQFRSGFKLLAVYASFDLATIVYSVLTVQFLSRLSVSGKSYFFIQMLGQELLMAAIPIFAWKCLQKRPLDEMGLTPPKDSRKNLLTGLLAGFGAITLNFLILSASGSIRSSLDGSRMSWDILLYLFLFFCVGFSEEVLGRGYAVTILLQTGSKTAAMVLSALIFAFLHRMNAGFSPLAFLNLTLTGLLLSYLFLETGNIWLTTGFHTAWNVCQGILYGLPVSGIRTGSLLTTEISSAVLLNGGIFGPEGGLACTVSLLIVSSAAVIFFRRKKADSNPERSSL